MNKNRLTISVVPERLAVCHLESHIKLPNWVTLGDFYNITKTADEISVICTEENVPQDVISSRGWRAFKVEGTLDLNLVGITASLSRIFAEADINILVVATYDTDYILVKEQTLGKAKDALKEHHIVLD